MKTKRRDGGFSLLEVILAMSVLVIGALVTLTVMATTAQRNEKGKIDAVGYKACQDMLEVLMSMPYADIQNLQTWSVNTGTALTFDVVAAGFPRQPSGQPIRGTYSLRDVSTAPDYNFGFPVGTTNRAWEIIVRIDYQQIRIGMIALRKDPGYQ